MLDVKATFPHLLHLDVALGILYPLLGIEIVPPPPITQKTIEIGVKFAPQNACFPLKVTLGNFIEGIEHGADTLFMAGGVGPCRFGYYGQIQRLILEDLGYDVRFVLIDHPRYGMKAFLETLRSMAGGRVASLRVVKAASLAWKVLRFTEDLETQRRALRCQVEKKENLDYIVDSAIERLRNIESVYDFERIRRETEEKLAFLPRRQRQGDLIKVGIVGEVYVAQETRINFNVERILGDLGVYVHNSVSTVEYVLHTLPLTRSQEKLEAWKMAQPYLKRFVGGEGIDSVGSAVRYAKKGFDGVVHLYPFTCMPEIVAKGILNKVSKDYNLPILHLAIDEHSGEAGLVTRVEAFVDVLERRKKKRSVTEVDVLWISS